MTDFQMFISLGATLLSGAIGGLLAIWAALVSVKRSEFYRLRGQLKAALFDVEAKISAKHSGHPAKFVIENLPVDSLAIATIAVSPRHIKKNLQTKWDHYRYGENKESGIIPHEYAKPPEPAKRVIIERLHEVISNL